MLSVAAGSGTLAAGGEGNTTGCTAVGAEAVPTGASVLTSPRTGVPALAVTRPDAARFGTIPERAPGSGLAAACAGATGGVVSGDMRGIAAGTASPAAAAGTCPDRGVVVAAAAEAAPKASPPTACSGAALLSALRVCADFAVVGAVDDGVTAARGAAGGCCAAGSAGLLVACPTGAGVPGEPSAASCADFSTLPKASSPPAGAEAAACGTALPILSGAIVRAVGNGHSCLRGMSEQAPAVYATFGPSGKTR